MKTFKFHATGTTWTIDIYNEIPDQSSIKIERLVRDRINEYEDNYSRFRENSFINRISKTPATYTLTEDAKNLFDTYKKLYDISDGLVTPLIGQTLSEAGYDEKYSLTEKEISKNKSWDEVLEYNFPTITSKQKHQIDLGGIGKGYIIDIIGELLEEYNIIEYCIDAGGDILHKSANNSEIKVGLEDPDNSAQVLGVYTLSNMAICGSAGNRRAWGKYHHIINPKTQKSVSTIKAVWAVASSTTIADAMTSGLFFVDTNKLLANFQFEYLIIHSDNTINKSSGFTAEIYYA